MSFFVSYSLFFPMKFFSFYLAPCAEITRISAGILSPLFTSTRSPATTSSASMIFFSPSRITRAFYITINVHKHEYPLYIVKAFFWHKVNYIFIPEE